MKVNLKNINKLEFLDKYNIRPGDKILLKNNVNILLTANHIKKYNGTIVTVFTRVLSCFKIKEDSGKYCWPLSEIQTNYSNIRYGIL